MDKYTVIIPTLWKSNRTSKLFDDLKECEYVDEVIIIDNQWDKPFDRLDGKFRIIGFGENIYVNPAWNKGIELAKKECIALCNDDINFDPNIFGVITENTLMYSGIVGMGEGNYKDPIDEERGPYIDMWKPGVNDWGWGCLILLKKAHWKPIPNEINLIFPSVLSSTLSDLLSIIIISSTNSQFFKSVNNLKVLFDFQSVGIMIVYLSIV